MNSETVACLVSALMFTSYWGLSGLQSHRILVFDICCIWWTLWCSVVSDQHSSSKNLRHSFRFGCFRSSLQNGLVLLVKLSCHPQLAISADHMCVFGHFILNISSYLSLSSLCSFPPYLLSQPDRELRKSLEKQLKVLYWIIGKDEEWEGDQSLPGGVL